MTSLIKPDDSWRHNIPKKHLCGIFRVLFCPSLDKGKMESVYSVYQQTTVMASLDGREWERLRYGMDESFIATIHSLWGMVTHPQYLECLVGSGQDEEEFCIHENHLNKSLKAHSIYHQLFEQDLHNQFLSSMMFFNTVYIPQLHPLQWYHLVVCLAPWEEALYLIHFLPPRAFVTQQMFRMFGEKKSEWKDNHWLLFNYTHILTHICMYVYV